MTIAPTTSAPPRGSELPTDAELIERSLVDAGAFGLVFERHVAAIHRFVAMRIGPDQAEDVVAEAFATAFDRRRAFDPSAVSARPWLYGIAANRLRKHASAQAAWLRRAALAPHDVAGDDGASADERVDAQRLAPRIAHALLRLTGAERDVLLLAVLEGLDGDEIGRALGIRSGAARTRLSRARARLRDAFDELGDDETTEERHHG